MTKPVQSPAIQGAEDGQQALRFVRLETTWIQALVEMLETVDRRFFHPHPFSREAIEPLVDSRDEYWLLVKGEAVVGYGMLRGWEEGYAIPSLGIAVAASNRGQGHGERIMHFLHGRAARRRANQVRLTVEAENQPARALYYKLGYRQAADGPDAPWFLSLFPASATEYCKSDEMPPP
ncbi:MAG: GNAT family N-acetyltransferase [Planctomycetota bacterium]